MDEQEFEEKFREASHKGMKELQYSVGKFWPEALGWLNFTVGDLFSLPAFIAAYEKAGHGCKEDLFHAFNRVPTTPVILAHKKIARELRAAGYPAF